MSRCTRFLVGILFMALVAGSLPAQSIYGTLTGIVSDPSGAVLANANIVLRDENSGSQRDTKANNEGYYTFVSLPPGSYQLNVSTSGFEAYKQSGITVRGGDKMNVNVTLKIGSTSNVVEVVGNAELAPVDSGENSNRLTSAELDNFVQMGVNAAEFLKIMPGFGIVNGTSNSASYNGQTIGINGNGDGGNQSPLNGAYSYNGLPGNSLDITADGAHVSDPGCNCATPVNPNSKMISEIKVTMSNFSAENQKGPGVISSVAKGGGRDFHGSIFGNFRNSELNANDWLSNYSKIAKPVNAYYYPGFTLGGPVILPFTNFNKKRDKLFFFTGYNYFYQTLDTGLLRDTVPTTGMRNGDFSPAELAKLGRIDASGAAPTQINSIANRGGRFPGGIIPTSAIDKNMQALMNLYPLPNTDPNATGGYNYVDDRTFNQNGFQWMSRADYSISDNTKLFVRYNMQRETQLFPIGLWSSSRTQQIPLPTPIEGKNGSDSVTASLTHVFNAKMTNEFVFGYTYIAFPNNYQDPSKIQKSKVGYNYPGYFNTKVDEIPNIAASGSLPGLANYGGYEVGGARGLYADKWMPSVSDNFSMVWGKHTLKMGFFWEHIRNSQPNNSYTNGNLNFNSGQSNSLGNVFADFLIGNLNSYTETSFDRINDIGYHTVEGFVQDQWKVSRRLTVDAGIRITHFQPWNDNLGFGFSVFDPSKFSTACPPTQYCGFLWHARDNSIPNGGFPSRFAYWQPRFGLAYDVFGTGKTVLRGGWGKYVYHSAQFTTGLDVSSGMQTVTLTNNQGPGNTPLVASQLSAIAATSNPLSIGAVDRTDDHQPVTDSYSFTLSQRVPWSSLVEVSYVGNQSRYLLNNRVGGPDSDVNRVPVGAMLSVNNGGKDPNSLTANNFRPFAGTGDIYLATNDLYSNYNSLQVKWMRAKGRAVISANYTYGKAMGILNPSYDAFNLNNTYGVQGSNRPHIANAAYSYNFGKVVENKFAGGIANGWQVSGILQFQSGANLYGNRLPNYSLALNGAKIPGTTFNVSTTALLGTPNITITPVQTCDPTKNLGPNQFINASCYAIPTAIGQNGPTVAPPIYGPGYFNADLGVFKNFAITERKRLQIRMDGYNFLNHPLWSFPAGSSALNLSFSSAGALSSPLFGTVTQKQGHRIVQLSANFTF